MAKTTRGAVAELARRIAAELRSDGGGTPRTFEFRLRDDSWLRAIDQVTSTGSRVLLLEAYRGVSAVLNPVAAVRRDGPVDAPWFADGMSARDEGTAISALERAIDMQLAGADHASRGADVAIDVRDGAAGGQSSYAPRYARTQYAAALAPGPLVVALAGYLVVWIAYGAGMLVAPPPPAVAVVALVGMLLGQLVTTIALMSAGIVGRAGNAVAVIALSLLPVILTPLAVASAPVGPTLAWLGGLVTFLAAVLAAGAPPSGWFGLLAFGVVGVIGIVIGSLAGGSGASMIVAASMLAATAVGTALLWRGIRIARAAPAA